MRNSGWLGLGVVLGCVLAPVAARANSNSLVTFGLGASAGVSRDDGGDAFLGDVRARVRVLRLFGAELAYSPAGWHGRAAAPVDRPNVGVSGLLYVLPTSMMSIYGKAGLAAPALDQIRLGRKRSAFHAGGGIDFALGDHVVLAAELMLVRGPSGGTGDTSLSRTLSSLTLDRYNASWTLLYYL